MFGSNKIPPLTSGCCKTRQNGVFRGLPSLGTEIRDDWELSYSGILNTLFYYYALTLSQSRQASGKHGSVSARSRNSGGHLAQ